MSVVYRGKKIAPGAAMGRVLKLQKHAMEIPTHNVGNPDKEILFFRACHAATVADTEKLLEQAEQKYGKHELEILDAQMSILKDEYAVIEPIEETILEQRFNAAKAIDTVLGEIAAMFRESGDEYMSQRAADAEDVRRRLLAQALGCEEVSYEDLPEGTILAAHELQPSDTIRINLNHVAGIILECGGYYSHVGIIARNRGIPTVCGPDDICSHITNGEHIIVDGDCGQVSTALESEDFANFSEQLIRKNEEAERLSAFLFVDSHTADGEQGLVCANIGTSQEAEIALSAGAEGIGLMRSEFLYMDHPTLPDEETQFIAYKNVLETMGDRPVIIRTLDIGGDKNLPALPLPKEDNPFLGCRAIRLCLLRPELFKIQLRALLRASVYGNLHIMLPMISCIEELREGRRMIEDARQELQAEGIATADVKIGIMIEIPAAALIADQLAKESDFFSIGTNDLIQYTVATERGNAEVEHLYTPYHPAVLRLIDMTVKAARRQGILCGMCGEAAADPLLIPVFWGMGLREFSMSPGAIAIAKKTLSEWTGEATKVLAESVLACESSEAVKLKLQTQ